MKSKNKIIIIQEGKIPKETMELVKTGEIDLIEYLKENDIPIKNTEYKLLDGYMDIHEFGITYIIGYGKKYNFKEAISLGLLIKTNKTTLLNVTEWINSILHENENLA